MDVFIKLLHAGLKLNDEALVQQLIAGKELDSQKLCHHVHGSSCKASTAPSVVIASSELKTDHIVLSGGLNGTKTDQNAVDIDANGNVRKSVIDANGNHSNRDFLSLSQSMQLMCKVQGVSPRTTGVARQGGPVLVNANDLCESWLNNNLNNCR